MVPREEQLTFCELGRCVVSTNLRTLYLVCFGFILASVPVVNLVLFFVALSYTVIIVCF